DTDVLRCTTISTRIRIVPDRDGERAVRTFRDESIGEFGLRPLITQAVQHRERIEGGFGNIALRDEAVSTIEWRLDYPLLFEHVREGQVRHARSQAVAQTN